MTTAARSPGRPINTSIDTDVLAATADLLVEQGFERLTMDEVVRRCGASKTTIYRRWPSKAALAVAAAEALLIAPVVPDTADLREDLLECARAYVLQGGRTAQVLVAVMTAARRDPSLRETSYARLGDPWSGLFKQVLERAVARGQVPADVDIDVLAEVFPAIAYQRTAARGLLVTDDDATRVVDAVLLPALGRGRRAGGSPTS